MIKPPAARLLAAAVIVGASALLTGAGVAFAAFSAPTAAAGSNLVRQTSTGRARLGWW